MNQHKYYLVRVYDGRHFYDTVKQIWIDERKFESLGPCKAKTLSEALDLASKKAEQLHAPVVVYQNRLAVERKVRRNVLINKDELDWVLDKSRYKYVESEDYVLQSYGTSKEMLLDFVKSHDIKIDIIITGSPDEDNDHEAQFNSLRKRFSREDKLERRFCFGVTNYSRWEYKNKWENKTGLEILEELFTDRNHLIDISSFFNDFHWIQRDVGFHTGKLGYIQITIARFGYDFDIVFGEANKRDQSLNRFASACCGIVGEDFTAEDVTSQSESVRMIAKEWVSER